MVIIIIAGGLLIYILYSLVNLMVHGYRDFNMNREEIKSELFNDSVIDYFRTDVMKRNIHNDTFLCYFFRNQFLVVCWKIKNYNSISPSQIRLTGPMTLDIKSRGYEFYSGGKRYRALFGMALDIRKPSVLKLAFHVSDTTSYMLSSSSGLLLNLVCSNVGIFTTGVGPDILIQPKSTNLSMNLLMYNTGKSFYVLGFFPMSEDTVSTSKILPLLNPKTFNFLNAKYHRISD